MNSRKGDRQNTHQLIHGQQVLERKGYEKYTKSYFKLGFQNDRFNLGRIINKQVSYKLSQTKIC